MRIAIDARWIFPHISGIGSHTRELIRHLAILEANSANEFVLLFNHPEVQQAVMADQNVRDNPRFTSEHIPYSPFSPKSQYLLPRQLSKLNLDVYHSTNWMIPFAPFPRFKAGSIRCVITIHDMIPLKYPEFTPRAIKTRLLPLFKYLMSQVAARADHIITVSNCSKSDVIELLRVDPASVTAIPNGVDERYIPGPEITTRSPTILYVGRLDPYKNVSTLIRAFKTILTDLPDTRLRIIGPPDDRYPEATQLIEQLDLKPYIEWDGYLTDSQLLNAYQGAKVLVLPSRYEGFGLPVIEAMACATPVVCSNTSSLPEVAGNAAVLVNPNSEEELAASLKNILCDPLLAESLSKKGPAQAARFNWNSIAEKTLKTYKHPTCGA